MVGRGELRDRIGRAAPPGLRRAMRGGARRVARRTAVARALPGALVIGAQRGGTTTLYHYLTQHPQFLGTVADKEVHHFDLHVAEGLDAYRGAFPTTAKVRRTERRIGGRIVVGEATPYYLFHPAVPARVAADLPQVRLIAVLRDPVERAWSHYRHEVDLGHEALGFADALAAEGERLAGEAERLLADPSAVSFAHQHHAYVARGRYLEQLERWWAVFPRGQLLLVRSEDLHADPAATLDSITAHLGIRPWQPPAWRTYNASTSTDMPAAARARLRETFRRSNDRLAEATGRDWSWERDPER
ncbi:MAG: sulfotransferase [Actinomycetota bacterium]